MNQRKAAKITGIALLTMTVLAIFSIGYAYEQFDNSKNYELLINIINHNMVLYQSMIIGILFIIILDFIVSYTLYKYFEKKNKKTALLSGVIRGVYTVTFGIATFYLTKNLNPNEAGDVSFVCKKQLSTYHY